MLRGVPPPPPPPPDPLQPANPAATHANSSSPTAAYPTRFPIGRRRCIAKMAISRKHRMPSGSTGICGRVRGTGKGTNCESAVVSEAVHNAVPEVEAVAAVGVHVMAAPRLLDPFRNCTVPVGPAPLLLVEIVAVRVTL